MRAWLPLAIAACGSPQQGTAPGVATHARPEATVMCREKLGTLGRLAPALAIADERDRAFAIGLRADAMYDACSSNGWNTPANRCMASAHDTPGFASCVALLPSADARSLALAIATADDRFRALAAVRERGAPIDCSAVVDEHYGDSAWDGRLEHVVGAPRAAMIAASRELMMKACTNEAWSALVRSCVVSGGKGECFAAGGLDETGWRWSWSYPPLGVIVPTGIPECDAMEATEEASPCRVDKGICVIQHAHNIEDSATWAQRGAVERANVVKECREIDDAVKQELAGSGS